MLKQKLGWLLIALPESVRGRAESLLATADTFLKHVLLPTWSGEPDKPWWERVIALLPMLAPLFEALVRQATRDPDIVLKLFNRLEKLVATLADHPELLDSVSDIFAQALERSSGQAVTFFDWLTQPQTTERALELLTIFERLVMRWIEEAT